MILDRFRLDGQRALVTGASRGIGRAMAVALAEAGADVALVSRKEEGLRETAAQIEPTGRQTLVVAANCGRREEIDRLAETVLSHWGGVDILINNAATNPRMGPLTTVEESVWDKTFDVNLKGPFLLSKTFAKGMQERGWGRIINISSNGGVRPVAVLSTYCITKAALITMTEVLSQELGRSGVTVNAIAPGLIETQMSQALTSNPPLLERTLQGTALGRVGQPEDIAGLAVYLASDASAFVTGEVFVADGGHM